MRRKKLEYNFRQNFEWLESPENHGLVLPYYRLFCPNLSKSAPCKCCAGGSGCETCQCCNDLNPPLKIMDSTQGHWVNANTGPDCGIQGVFTNTFNDSNFLSANPVRTPANCNAGPNAGSNIICVGYNLSCHAGPPVYYALGVSFYRCCTTLFCSNGTTACPSAFSSDHFLVTTSLNCSYPDWQFTYSGTTLPNPSPYSNNGFSVRLTAQ